MMQYFFIKRLHILQAERIMYFSNFYTPPSLVMFRPHNNQTLMVLQVFPYLFFTEQNSYLPATVSMSIQILREKLSQKTLFIFILQRTTRKILPKKGDHLLYLKSILFKLKILKKFTKENRRRSYSIRRVHYLQGIINSIAVKM